MWLWQPLSSFAKSPSGREGECLGPSATRFAPASLGTRQRPLSPRAFGRAISQAAAPRGRQEKARDEITTQLKKQEVDPWENHLTLILFYSYFWPGRARLVAAHSFGHLFWLGQHLPDCLGWTWLSEGGGLQKAGRDVGKYRGET